MQGIKQTMKKYGHINAGKILHYLFEQVIRIDSRRKCSLHAVPKVMNMLVAYSDYMLNLA